MNLGETAQTILERADSKDLLAGPNGIPMGYVLRIKVLLALGRTAEVRDAFAELEETLDKDKKPNWGFLPEVGLPTYAWFEVVVAAATGDYAAADKVLGLIEQHAKSYRDRRRPDF